MEARITQLNKDEILRYLQGDKPEKLAFDDMGVLRRENGEPFFENV